MLLMTALVVATFRRNLRNAALVSGI